MGEDIGSKLVIHPWREIVQVANGVKGGNNNTIILDERAECQHPKSEEERADWDSDSTVLDEEEEEEGEWYDSDDTAFEHEDDDIYKLRPQSDTPTKFEPEGMWSSSEAISMGSPW